MRRKGFTIIEVLVAITVLLTVISVPMGIISRYLAQNALNRDVLQAQLYVQETIEMVRAQRDNNLLDGNTTNWVAEFDHCLVESFLDESGCTLRLSEESDGFITKIKCGESCTEETYFSNKVSAESNACSETFRSQSAEEIFSSEDDEDDVNRFRKIFVRSLQVKFQDEEKTRVTIRACVSWNDGNKQQKLIAEETLFKWLSVK